MKGSCQLCGVIAATDPQTGFIVSHEGPKSWSFMKENGCPSIGGLPYQTSQDLLLNEIDEIAASVSKLKQQVRDIVNRPGNIVMRHDHGGSHQMSPFELGFENKHIWTQETRSADIQEAIGQYKIWEAYPIEKRAVELAGYEFWLQNQLANWQMTPLIAGNGRQTISSLNKKRTADMRLAKQTAKDKFDYAVKITPYYEKLGEEFLDEDWLAKEILSQRKSAVGVALRIFSLPNRGIDCQTWNGNNLLKAHCSNLKEFSELFEKSDGGFRVACRACAEVLSISNGEAVCSREIFSHRLFLIQELSIISKALTLGTPLIHLYLQENGHSPRWIEIDSWNLARKTICREQVHSCECYCGLCKAQLTFDVNDLHCECDRPSEIERLKQSKNTSFFSALAVALKKPFKATGPVAKPISLAPEDMPELNVDASDQSEGSMSFDFDFGDVTPPIKVFDLEIPTEQLAFDKWFKLLRLCDVYHQSS